jgi:hypothetical protein
MKQNFKNIFAGFGIFAGIYFLVDLNENEAIVMTMLFILGISVYEYFRSKSTFNIGQFSLVFVGGFLGYLLTSYFIV